MRDGGRLPNQPLEPPAGSSIVRSNEGFVCPPLLSGIAFGFATCTNGRERKST
jgi:hypothetical protein